MHYFVSHNRGIGQLQEHRLTREEHTGLLNTSAVIGIPEFYYRTVMRIAGFLEI
jgi:hypothetical protein